MTETRRTDVVGPNPVRWCVARPVAFAAFDLFARFVVKLSSVEVPGCTSS
jgi:hypothetical protein